MLVVRQAVMVLKLAEDAEGFIYCWNNEADKWLIDKKKSNMQVIYQANCHGLSDVRCEDSLLFCFIPLYID